MKIPITKKQFFDGVGFTINNHIYSCIGTQLLLHCGSFTYGIGTISINDAGNYVFIPNIVGESMYLTFEPERYYIFQDESSINSGILHVGKVYDKVEYIPHKGYVWYELKKVDE